MRKVGISVRTLTFFLFCHPFYSFLLLEALNRLLLAQDSVPSGLPVSRLYLGMESYSFSFFQCFYFLELKEKDPWGYACYHCTGAANLYSDVHWHHYPNGDKGESEHHAEIIVL